MTHYFTRCIHCHRVYSYQGSGEGCSSPENSRYYCPECQKIINSALEKHLSKDKIISRHPKEVDIEVISPEIRQKMKDLKIGHILSGNGLFPSVCQMVGQLDYDNIDIYDIDLIRYYVCWNNDEKEKQYFIDYEYNFETKEYGDVYVDYDYNRDRDINYNSYRQGLSWVRTFMKINEVAKINKTSNEIKTKEISDLFDDLCYWEVKPKENKE